MGTKAALPVEEYLRTTFPDLDKEYRDGVLVERSLPDYLHGKTQGLLFAFFAALRKTLSVFPAVETRLKLQANVYLIPDVVVFYPSEPQGGVPDSPPLIAIEVVSRDDKMAKLRQKLEDYHAWGIPHVWLVDPHSKRLYTCDAGLVEVSTLKVPELSIEVTPGDIFE